MAQNNLTEYITKTQTIRLERQQRLINNPLGWFSLAGLYPLKDGVNHFSNNENECISIVQLKNGVRGSILIESGKAYLQNTSSPGITLNGHPPHSNPLRADIDGDPDLIEAGGIAMRIISRGGSFFLRVWDRQSPEVINFKGLNFFPVNPVYKVVALFTPFDPPLVLKKTDVIGTEYEQPFIGCANFTVSGMECSLIAEDDEDGLLFSFTDETRRDATYPAGRYLLTKKPVNNQVVMDFNLAVNWPCAYTPYATCPLPPIQNRLAVRIEAGEKRYHSDF